MQLCADNIVLRVGVMLWGGQSGAVHVDLMNKWEQMERAVSAMTGSIPDITSLQSQRVNLWFR